MATSPRAAVSAARYERSEEREWRASDDSRRISFARRTLDQMRFEPARMATAEGPQGVAGLLLGTRLGDLLRIVRCQPILCDHTLGPEFHLSDREEAGLAALLDELKLGVESQYLQVLGWFVTHLDGDLRMTAEESQLHRKLFADDQFVLVGRSGQLGEMQLAVYYPSGNGTAEENPLSPLLSLAPDSAAPSDRNTASSRRQRQDRPLAEPEAIETATPEAAAPVPLPVAAPRPNLLVPVLMTLALLAASGAVYWSWNRLDQPAVAAKPAVPPVPLELVSLHAQERNGRVFFAWNGKADALRGALQVQMLIEQGGKTIRWDLTGQEVASGRRAFRRGVQQVKATMVIHRPDGSVVEESTQYLAPPPAAGTEPPPE